MTKYYKTTDTSDTGVIDKDHGVSFVTRDNGETLMISYLCHIPGKVTFTVTATPISSVNMKEGRNTL